MKKLNWRRVGVAILVGLLIFLVSKDQLQSRENGRLIAIRNTEERIKLIGELAEREAYLIAIARLQGQIEGARQAGKIPGKPLVTVDAAKRAAARARAEAENRERNRLRGEKGTSAQTTSSPSPSPQPAPSPSRTARPSPTPSRPSSRPPTRTSSPTPSCRVYNPLDGECVLREKVK